MRRLVLTKEGAEVENRSMPPAGVIPVLEYEDVAGAVEWLCSAFGFVERVRIGTHRAQLSFEGAALVVAERSGTSDENEVRHSVMVRVENVDQHAQRAREHGATILRPPADHPYGERQYTAEDPGGHRWTFSQSIEDVAPEEWGGTTIEAWRS